MLSEASRGSLSGVITGLLTEESSQRPRMHSKQIHIHIRTPRAPWIQCCVSKRVTAGGSCETRKLRNADCNTHASTLNIGVRGFWSTVACALFAACATYAGHVGAVANFLPSTVADSLSSVSFEYLLHSGVCCRLSSTTKFFAMALYTEMHDNHENLWKPAWKPLQNKRKPWKPFVFIKK